jgi:predicted DNA-binding transcriptional regulator YafY
MIVEIDCRPTVRIARIIVILRENAKRNRKITGSELASIFGVTQRSIYRSMHDIIESGLPVLGIAGDGYVWKPAPGDLP